MDAHATVAEREELLPVITWLHSQISGNAIAPARNVVDIAVARKLATTSA